MGHLDAIPVIYGYISPSRLPWGCVDAAGRIYVADGYRPRWFASTI